MIHINLLPKPKKEESIVQLKNVLSAGRKFIQWHSDNLIKLQDQQIKSLESILRLHGIMK